MPRSTTSRHLDFVFQKAVSFRGLGQQEEAAEGFRKALQLDARDRRFARYWLAACLLDLDRQDELRQLLAGHDESTPPWRYARALLAFRLRGDSDEARRLLEEASRLDAGFLDYLLGESLVYADRPVRFGRDGAEATHSLAALFLPAWRNTPGAASWARRVLKVPVGDIKEELPFPRRELLELPQRKATWQIGLCPLDDEESQSDEGQVWGLAIVNLDERTMLHMTVIEGDTTPAAVWRGLLVALLQPMEGKPHRPARMEVPRADLCRAWKSIMEELSIECVFQRDPQPVTQMLQGMALLLREQRLPPMSDNLDPRELPRTDAVWQADLFRSPMMISNEDVGVERPWAAIVVDKGSGFVLSNELLSGEPTPEDLWEHLLRTMAHPGPQPPMRPARVELSDSDSYDFLKPKLDELGVVCALLDELPELEEFCESLASSCGGPEICALADGKGVTREQMEAFYYAAARYFEQAPWKHVAGEIPIEIRCHGLNLGTLYAIVLGRTGVTMGLALYRGWSEVLAMLRGKREIGEISGFSVIFEEATIMAPADLHLVERNGWPIRTPEAYPVVLRLEPGRQPHSPGGEELDFIESCLRVVPEFVVSGQRTKTFEIETNGKQVKLRLAWKSPW